MSTEDEAAARRTLRSDGAAYLQALATSTPALERVGFFALSLGVSALLLIFADLNSLVSLFAPPALAALLVLPFEAWRSERGHLRAAQVLRYERDARREMAPTLLDLRHAAMDLTTAADKLNARLTIQVNYDGAAASFQRELDDLLANAATVMNDTDRGALLEVVRRGEALEPHVRAQQIVDWLAIQLATWEQ